MMKRLHAHIALVLTAMVLATAVPARAETAAGQITWGAPVSLPPAWFDPADATGILIPFMVYYALHDALVKPMPGNPLAPCLAESWTASPDGLTYDFVLRKGIKFHTGELITAEDVKFSFERYRGAGAKMLKDRVAAVEVVDTGHVRFRLKRP